MQHFRVFDRDRILAVFLFVFAFASYADTNYYDNRNSNAVSRMGLVLSLVHQGRLDIEAFAPLTTDKALVGGTHYSDKAPGVAFLALPAAAVARAVAMALGRDGGLAPFFEDGHVSGAYDRAAWLATLSTSALLGALGVVAVFGAARLMGAGPAGALFAALACGFGTPYWGWATEFIGHTPAAALLALAVWVALVLGKADRPGDTLLAVNAQRVASGVNMSTVAEKDRVHRSGIPVGHHVRLTSADECRPAVDPGGRGWSGGKSL